MTLDQFTYEIIDIISWLDEGNFTEKRARTMIVDHAKAYAKSEVEKAVAAKDKHIAELKADLNQAQQMYTDLITGTEGAINTLKAENKRMRDEAEVIKTANNRLREGISDVIHSFKFRGMGTLREMKIVPTFTPSLEFESLINLLPPSTAFCPAKSRQRVSYDHGGNKWIRRPENAFGRTWIVCA